MPKHLLVTAAFALSVAAVACHVGEATDIVETYQAATTTKAITCSSPFIDVDLSKLKECGGTIGKGHCFDKTKGIFDPTQLTQPGCADGELCVPDSVLGANGKPAKSCKSLGDQPGACTSLLNQQLNENKGAVPPDVCDAETERCAPCIDPRTGKDSGACSPLGAHEQPCTGGKGDKNRLCSHGVGTCVQKSSVPSGDADQLNQDSCPTDSLVCAPSSLVNGDAPKTCDVLGVSGVCLDTCFNDMLGGLKAAARGDCGPTEVCVPCVVGKSQGLPGCD
jgi:hypothetical protein